MEITEVEVKLPAYPGRVMCYATIVVDNALVVRDIKVVKSFSGKVFVAMPSRALTDHCAQCSKKNVYTANYCHNCGLPQTFPKKVFVNDQGMEQYHTDVVFPIDRASRAKIEDAVLGRYREADPEPDLEGYEYLDRLEE